MKVMLQSDKMAILNYWNKTKNAVESSKVQFILMNKMIFGLLEMPIILSQTRWQAANPWMADCLVECSYAAKLSSQGGQQKPNLVMFVLIFWTEKSWQGAAGGAYITNSCFLHAFPFLIQFFQHVLSIGAGLSRAGTFARVLKVTHDITEPKKIS